MSEERLVVNIKCNKCGCELLPSEVKCSKCGALVDDALNIDFKGLDSIDIKIDEDTLDDTEDTLNTEVEMESEELEDDVPEDDESEDNEVEESEDESDEEDDDEEDEEFDEDEDEDDDSDEDEDDSDEDEDDSDEEEDDSDDDDDAADDDDDDDEDDSDDEDESDVEVVSLEETADDGKKGNQPEKFDSYELKPQDFIYREKKNDSDVPVTANQAGKKVVRKVRKVKNDSEKKSHKGLLIWIIVIVVLIAIIAVLLANWSKIFHKHSWVEATCEKAAYCSECNEIEGEPLGHSYEGATCEKPSTCSRCGLTQGEALGHIYPEVKCGERVLCTRCNEYSEEMAPHTTDVGICEICGLFQNENLLFETALCWNDVVNSMNGVFADEPEDTPDETSEEAKPATLKTEEEMALSEQEAITKAAEEAENKHRDDVYNDICTRIYNYQHAIEPLEKLIDACAEHEGLKNIKSKAEELLSAIPLSYVSKEDEAMLEFMQNEEQLLQMQKDINDEIMGMLSSYFSQEVTTDNSSSDDEAIQETPAEDTALDEVPEA